MTIYIDVVLLENIILNYIILISTATISKSKYYFYRMAISSVIGGIFSILNYIIEISNLGSVILKIFISILMIIISFKVYTFFKIIKKLIFFYLVSFTFGGIAFMLLFLINPNNVKFVENQLTGTYPLKIVILAGAVGFIIISGVSIVIKNKINKKEMICDLEIFYNGKNKKIKTMIDTGNLLKEPISKNDVIIVEKDSLKELVSKEILENIAFIVNGKWIDSIDVHSYKFKIIPFSSLGKDNGILIGFKPDYIKIYNENEVIRNDVLIGIYDGKLSKCNLYTSLIGLDVIT